MYNQLSLDFAAVTTTPQIPVSYILHVLHRVRRLQLCSASVFITGPTEREDSFLVLWKKAVTKPCIDF